MPRTVSRPIEPPVQRARARCSICADQNVLDLVERKLAEGNTPAKVEAYTRSDIARAAGFRPIKQETVSAHVKGCTARREATKARRRPAPELPASILAYAQGAAEASVPAVDPGEDDIATMVKKRTAERIRDGELEPTIKDGLRAQEIIDRRAEKQRGREVAIQFARLLAGVNVPRNVLPSGREEEDESVIEGVAVEVEA